MTISENKTIEKDQLVNLYEDAGWTIYSADPEKLARALEQSLDVLTIWEEGRLTGLLRTVGDGLTLVYVQDILVLKSHKRRGIGRKLMNRVLEKYRHVRQIVLLTDLRDETVGFYENLQFAKVQSLDLCAFIKINQ